jgi:hypothetical protein
VQLDAAAGDDVRHLPRLALSGQARDRVENTCDDRTKGDRPSVACQRRTGCPGLARTVSPCRRRAHGPCGVYSHACHGPHCPAISDREGDLCQGSVWTGAILMAAVATTLRADVLFTADPDDMDAAEKHDLLQPRIRVDLLTSHLSLIAPRTSQPVLALPGDGMQLSSYLGEHGRLAIGNPAVIESGRYAKASLEAMGWWQALAGRLAVQTPCGRVLPWSPVAKHRWGSLSILTRLRHPKSA